MMINGGAHAVIPFIQIIIGYPKQQNKQFFFWGIKCKGWGNNMDPNIEETRHSTRTRLWKKLFLRKLCSLSFFLFWFGREKRESPHMLTLDMM